MLLKLLSFLNCIIIIFLSNKCNQILLVDVFHLCCCPSPPREILQGGQAYTSLTIQDFRSKIKPLVIFHKCFIAIAAECSDNTLYKEVTIIIQKSK